MWTRLIFYFDADNLKVSTIVSINFFLKNGSNSVWKLALKLRICVRFASTFNVERVAVLTYDLVICKDSNDCLVLYVSVFKYSFGKLLRQSQNKT